MAKLRVDGKGQDLGGGQLADGEVSCAVTELPEGCLLVEGERVVDFAADAVVGQVLRGAGRGGARG